MQDENEFDHLAELREGVMIEKYLIDMYEDQLASIPEHIKQAQKRLASLEDRIAKAQI